MRVLLVAPQPFLQERGTPLAVLMLAQALCAQGHTVDLLTFPEGRDVEIDGLRIIRIPAIPGVRGVPIGISWKKLVCDALLCCALFWLALRHRYDIIHAVEEAVFPAVLLRALTRVGVVYDMDSILGEQLISKWQRLRGAARTLAACENAVIRRVDAVFAVCSELADHVRNVAPGVPVFLIEDVALEGSSCEAVPAEPLRRQYDIRSALALYVGNLEPYQGVEELLEALALVGPETPLTLVVVGGSSEQVERVGALAERLGVAQRVKAIGARPVAGMADYLRQADILVSPRREGINTPMKVYSYMLSGKPILATRIRAHTQVLDDQCALLVAPEAEAMAEGLAALTRDPKLREKLGATARARAAKSYTLEVFREKVRRAYGAVSALQSGYRSARDGR
jgi:glycosyltransferase involved in cell wall biosynthesis